MTAISDRIIDTIPMFSRDLPCYRIVGGNEKLLASEIYVWFYRSGDGNTVYANTFPVYEIATLNSFSSGIKNIVRLEGAPRWIDRAGRPIPYSSDIEELLMDVLNRKVVPISKLTLMTHPMESLREVAGVPIIK